MKKQRVFVCALVLLLLSTLVLIGCGNTEDYVAEVEAAEEVEEVEEIEEEEEEPEPEYLVIGTETEDAYSVLLVNQMGLDIQEISVKVSCQTDFPENFMAADEVVEQEGLAKLFYTPAEVDESECPCADFEVEINPTYQVRIVLENEEVHELSAFDFEDFDGEVALLLEDGIAFVAFESLSRGEMVDTRDLEVAHIEFLAQQAAEAEEAARVAAEEEAARVAAEEAARLAAEAQAAADAAAAAAPPPEPVYTPAPPPPPAPPEQDVDICLPDVEINVW
ncbi:MAG: hypothetical protein FWE25_02820 [Lachnospiraceae bacterium]|nr:hypothetical protein [Lachnospiraceae bacterium]